MHSCVGVPEKWMAEDQYRILFGNVKINLDYAENVLQKMSECMERCEIWCTPIRIFKA